MLSNDFIRKYISKYKTISNIKIQQILSSWSLSDVWICLKDGTFKIDIEIVNLHPTKGTQWVAYIGYFYFDSYGVHYQTNCLGLL